MNTTVMFIANMLLEYQKKTDNDDSPRSFSYTINPITNVKNMEMTTSRITLTAPMNTILLASQSITAHDFHTGLVRYFKIVAPDLVGSINDLMSEYRYKEQVLLDILKEKYSRPVSFESV